MKKNRNTFFSNYNAQTQSYIPDPNMFMNYPNQTSVNSSYYNGPDLNYQNDFDNRLSKIERQINRLDNRLTKLENNNASIIPNKEENNYTNMYML